MSDFFVKTSAGEYAVEFRRSALASLMNAFDFVVVDSRLASRIVGSCPVFSLEASEAVKTLGSCESLLVAMRSAGCDRDARVLAIGGGVVQDVATFAASVYMRGVAWTYVPTTLMAMADSCIGGKSSINAGGFKNLIGNVYPPTAVVVDVAFAATLDSAAIASGLSEAVKICFAGGAAAFEQFVALRSDVSGWDSRAAEKLVAHSLRTKAWFVEVDEFDRAERQLLNFGHTFAHALEAASGFAVPHGVAVGVGMLAALHHPATVPSTLGDALRAECQEILRPLKPVLDDLARLVDWGRFDEALLTDKKHRHGTLRFVLPGRDGLVVVQVPREDRSVTVAREALQMGLAEVAA